MKALEVLEARLKKTLEILYVNDSELLNGLIGQYFFDQFSEKVLKTGEKAPMIYIQLRNTKDPHYIIKIVKRLKFYKYVFYDITCGILTVNLTPKGYYKVSKDVCWYKKSS